MQLIDVHHHIMPPAYAEVVGPRFQSRNEANGAQVMRWTPAESIEVMDRSGIAVSITSISTAGVGIMSNYGRVWPGDPRFAPVFDELNRRKAIVYVHPILPDACQDMMPGVGESALEYLFDTARAITSLIYNGSLLRWPDIRFIFP